MFHSIAVIPWSSKSITFIAELPEQRGMLFSDDEQKMEIDVSKTSSLMAVAKITLFEVDVGFLESSNLLNMCRIVEKPKARALPSV